MIQIKKFEFNLFQVNTYILYDNTKECVIIDPGCQTKQEEQILSDFINSNKLKPVKLLNTHSHIDHILGNNFVKQKYNLKIEAHKDDEIFIENAESHALTFGFRVTRPPSIDKHIDENNTIEFGNSKLHIKSVPGHSQGSLVFYNNENKFAITGDVLFKASIGRTDLPGGNYNLLISGIKQKLLSMNDDTKVYSGHGFATTIGEERRNNPFIN